MAVGLTIRAHQAIARSGDDTWHVAVTGETFADKAIAAIPVFAGQASAVAYPAMFSAPQVFELRSALKNAGLSSTSVLPEPVAAFSWLAASLEDRLSGHVAVWGTEGEVQTVALVRAGSRPALAGRPLEAAATIPVADVVRTQLADAELAPRDLSHILLTSSMSAAEIQSIADTLGVPVATDDDPASIVVRGAAIAAAAEKPVAVGRLMLAGTAAGVLVAIGALAWTAGEPVQATQAQVEDAVENALGIPPPTTLPTTTGITVRPAENLFFPEPANVGPAVRFEQPVITVREEIPSSEPEVPSSEAPPTEIPPPTTTSPPSVTTEPTVTAPPVTETPITEAPVTETPVTETPATETAPPETFAPVS